MKFKALVLSTGHSLASAASACGVEPALFDRIAMGAQPAPRRLLRVASNVLGLDFGDLVVACDRIVDDDMNAMTMRPVPLREVQSLPVVGSAVNASLIVPHEAFDSADSYRAANANGRER